MKVSADENSLVLETHPNSTQNFMTSGAFINYAKIHIKTTEKMVKFPEDLNE